MRLTATTQPLITRAASTSTLQAAHVPCSAESITEMIALMDARKSGCIAWDDFERFMTEEFSAGKSLTSGEYVLPSGERGGR